jgi:predicted nuclease with TOPRIM domain
MVEQTNELNDKDVKDAESEILNLEKIEKQNAELTSKLKELETVKANLIKEKEEELARLKGEMKGQEDTFKQHLDTLSKKFEDFDKKWDEFVPSRKGVVNTSENPFKSEKETKVFDAFINGDKDPREWHKNKDVVERAKKEFSDILGRNIF